MIKISVCQRQFPYVLNSVLFSWNTDASLNWFLFNCSLQYHQPFTFMYIHSLLQCHHLEENMWLITSVKIYSQTNISVNEPPSLLSWHKLRISAVLITQQAARSWAANHCMTFTVPSFHVSLQILHFPVVLLWSIVASRSRLEPYWEAVHWNWIGGFKFWLCLRHVKAQQSSTMQPITHH